MVPPNEVAIVCRMAAVAELLSDHDGANPLCKHERTAFAGLINDLLHRFERDRVTVPSQ